MHHGSYHYKSHDNCIHVVVIMIQNNDACPYLEVVDPEYPQRAKDVIDELAAEVVELRDNATMARHDFQLMQQDDRAVDREVRETMKKWKRWFYCAVAVNVVTLIFFLSQLSL